MLLTSTCPCVLFYSLFYLFCLVTDSLNHTLCYTFLFYVSPEVMAQCFMGYRRNVMKYVTRSLQIKRTRYRHTLRKNGDF